MSLSSRIVLSVQAMLSTVVGSGASRWNKIASARSVNVLHWDSSSASKLYCEDLTITGLTTLDLQSGLVDPLGSALSFLSVKALSISVLSASGGGALLVGGELNIPIPGSSESPNIGGLVAGDSVLITRAGGVAVSSGVSTITLSTVSGTVVVRVLILGS